MNKPSIASRWASLCAMFALSLAVAAEARPQATLAITNVTVIDATGAAPKRDHTVLIADGRIVAVGPSNATRAPVGASVVDGHGKYLIPGLWDLHVHLPFDGPDVLQVFVANGVMGIRELGRDIPSIEKIRAAGAAGTLTVPKIVATGNMIDAAEMKAVYGKSDKPVLDDLFDRERIFVANADEARQAVRKLATPHPDFLKLHHTMQRDVYFAVLEEARRAGLIVVGHYPMVESITLREVADAGQRTVEHLNFGSAPAQFLRLEPEEQRALLAHVKERGMMFVPTLGIGSAAGRYKPAGDRAARIAMARKDPRARYVSPLSWQTWEVLLAIDESFEEEAAAAGWNEKEQLAFLRKLHEAGLPILSGTDFLEPFLFPGSSLHEELVEMVKQVGMTPHEVLQGATRQAALAVGLQDSYGTIQTGKVADLVLLDADPLTAIENTQRIDGVVHEGQWLDRAALDELLAKSAATISKLSRSER